MFLIILGIVLFLIGASAMRSESKFTPFAKSIRLVGIVVILLGALSLLAGERADKSVIRQGAPACEVEAALFFADAKTIDGVLAELELPACEDGLLLLRREAAGEVGAELLLQQRHAFLAPAAVANGAAGVVVQRPTTLPAADSQAVVVEVPDTLQALQALLAQPVQPVRLVQKATKETLA